MTNSLKLVVSIVSFNTKELTFNCLKSLLENKSKLPFEIWVVDNASSDGSSLMIKKEFPQVNLIESNKNLGFGGGHNLVFKKIKAPYYLILNSDTLVKNIVFSQMVKFMEDNKCGIASCKVLGFDGRLQPNGGDLPLGLSLISWLFNLESLGVKSSFHRNDIDYYGSTRKVGWVSGNFMVIKKEVLDNIGFFNEDYFMYFEDVELCFRARKKGFEVMINPEISIKHLSGGSLDDPKFHQWLGELKGLIRFYNQQFGVALASIIKLLVLVSTVFRIFIFTLIGKLDYAKTYAKVIKSL